MFVSAKQRWNQQPSISFTFDKVFQLFKSSIS